MIETILLDLDGPLLDGKLRHYRCYADILAAHGYSPMPIDPYWDMKRLRKSRKEQLAVSGAEPIYDLFLSEWLERIEKPEYLALDLVQDGALRQLQGWYGRGIKLILVTMRSSRGSLMRQLQETGLLSFLARVIVCKHSNGREGKALEVLREIPDLEPSKCLWIGDTEADAEGAKYLGCKCHLLSCGLRTREYLSTLTPDFLAGNILDIDINKVDANVA